MLYDQTKHETLTSTLWNERVARETIHKILKDTDTSFSRTTFWKRHPSDRESNPNDPPMTSLFNGASSTAWSLLDLKEKGYAPEYQNDYLTALEPIYKSYLETPDSGDKVPGYLFGETGILTVIERFHPNSKYLTSLLESIQHTITRPENELMWAAPGTLIAAQLLFERSGHTKYIPLIKNSAEHILKEWKFDSDEQFYIWTQDLYGSKNKYLGGVHGFAGNVLSLLKAMPHLNSEQQKFILEKSIETLIKTSFTENDLTNWPPHKNATKQLTQWCHGAPGIITSFGDYPKNHSADLDLILLQAAELVWKSGPLLKPFGLCHGTAGNGYALLKMFTRTQDEKWLTRARSFAMHAIEQSNKCAKDYGRYRHELFTGDLGLAQYLSSCLQHDSAWPLIDTL